MTRSVIGRSRHQYPAGMICSVASCAAYQRKSGGSTGTPSPCGASAAVYCPINAVSPVAVRPGNSTLGPAAGRNASQPCPAGQYCPGDGYVYPCPAGTYGGSTGLANSSCSGPCAAGRLCSAGSTSPAGVTCPILLSSGYLHPVSAGHVQQCRGRSDVQRVHAVPGGALRQRQRGSGAVLVHGVRDHSGL